MLSLNPTSPRSELHLPIQTVDSQNRSDLDEKVYWYVGTALQAIAATGLVASAAAFYFIAWPIALASTITSFVLLMLGTFFTEEFFDSSTQPPPPPGGSGNANPDVRPVPFVPGQPVGIINEGSNCWAVSTMQMIMNIPSLIQCIENDAPFAGEEFNPLRDFIRQYRAAQQNHLPAPNLQTTSIRGMFHQLNPQMNGDGTVQEDAAEAFLEILGRLAEGTSVSNRIQISYDAVQADGNVRQTVRELTESVLHLDLNDPNASFEDRLDAIFNQQIPEGARDIRSNPEVRYVEPPREFILQANRFVNRQRTPGDASTTYLEKLNTPVAVPQNLTLPGRYMLNGQEERYECDAFVVHRGLTMGHGHYVTYIKKGDHWWCCDDRRLTQVGIRTINRAMQSAYFYHFSAARQ